MNTTETIANLTVIEDRYDGITIDASTISNSIEEFENQIDALLHAVTNKNLVWIKLPIEKSEYIPVLTNKGFIYHHCDETALMLIKKLIENPVIPTAKNYTVGVGAIVLDDNKLLVIKDRFQPGYKLPGGHIDDNEEIKDALYREVYEETGVKVAFESIVNLGHFTKGQFGESNLYIVCTAKPLSKEISIIDSDEIIEARWIAVDEFLALEDTNNYNRAVVKTAIENKERKLTDQSISLRIPSGYEVFF